jgi:Membrane-associated phospholipid phosphatase
MQLTVLMFFQKLSSTFLDFIAEFFTVFGEALPPLAILLAIYWCSSKKRGFALFTTLLCSLLTINIIKPVVRSDRPFVKYPRIKGKRVATATGFSFPSGHTVTAATFYPALALGQTKYRKRSLVLAFILSVLVGISRLYLGVHWPVDVVAGLAIGYLFTFLLYPVFDRLYDSRGIELFALITGIATGVLAFVLMVVLQIKPEFDTHFSDLMKMSCLAAGGMLGFFWDRKK